MLFRAFNRTAGINEYPADAKEISMYAKRMSVRDISEHVQSLYGIDTLKYIAYKDQKAFMKDLKRVYGAESEETAMRNLEGMMDTWKKYAVVLDSWLDKWEHLSTYFCYGYQIRRLIYTTYTAKKTIPTFPGIPVHTGFLEKVPV